MKQQLSWISNDSSIPHVIWKLYIDGAARGNPGAAGVGIYAIRDTTPMIREGFFIGTCTNNQAEYTALLLGVCRMNMLMAQTDELHIFSDSELLVKQIKNIYRVQNVALQRLYRRAKELLEGINYHTYHVPREQNRIADALANDGIDNIRHIPEDLQAACGVNHEGLRCN
jgi:ribonuclease HI